jgi:hypothetical protein
MEKQVIGFCLVPAEKRTTTRTGGMGHRAKRIQGEGPGRVRLRPNRSFPARPALQRRPTCFGRLPLILPINPIAHPSWTPFFQSRRDRIGGLIPWGEVEGEAIRKAPVRTEPHPTSAVTAAWLKSKAI